MMILHWTWRKCVKMAYCPLCQKKSRLIALKGEVVYCGWCGFKGYTSIPKDTKLDKVC